MFSQMKLGNIFFSLIRPHMLQKRLLNIVMKILHLSVFILQAEYVGFQMHIQECQQAHPPNETQKP